VECDDMDKHLQIEQRHRGPYKLPTSALATTLPDVHNTPTINKKKERKVIQSEYSACR